MKVMLNDYLLESVESVDWSNGQTPPYSVKISLKPNHPKFYGNICFVEGNVRTKFNFSLRINSIVYTDCRRIGYESDGLYEFIFDTYHEDLELVNIPSKEQLIDRIKSDMQELYKLSQEDEYNVELVAKMNPSFTRMWYSMDNGNTPIAQPAECVVEITKTEASVY